MKPAWQTASSMRVLDALEKGVASGEFRRTQLASALDLSSPATVQAHLNKLSKGGLIALDGRNPPSINPKGRVYLSLFRKGKIQ